MLKILKNIILLILEPKILILTLLFCILMNSMHIDNKLDIVIDKIQINSVHPTYGNYAKLSPLGKKCHPWDDCR